MHRRLALTVLALALCGFLSPSYPLSSDEFAMPELPTLTVNDRIPHDFVVMLRDQKENNEASIQDVLKKHSITSDRLFGRIGGFAATLKQEQVEKLKADPRVLVVEPNYKVVAYVQSLPTGIDRINAELNTIAKINGTDERVDVDIAIIDTGVQKSHPDLNVYKQVNFSRDFSADDQNGHGTHVAGTAAAKDNTVGVVGVAPGARIWSVKALDRNGAGSIADIARAVDYVTQNAGEIEVVNMSLGCQCVSQTLATAISRAVDKGIVFAIAAGNSAKDSKDFSPANHPDVITVSAIADFNGKGGGGAKSTCYSDVDDTFANFSNYGAAVDIAAPGVCITSTWKGSRYNTISGTSMASPHVAGAAALYIAQNGKPLNKNAALNVRDQLRAKGFSQASADGFTGDPDAEKEPVVHAGNL